MRTIRRAVTIAIWSTSTHNIAAFTLSNKTVSTSSIHMQRIMPSNIDFHHLRSVDSTQDEARRRIPHFSKDILAILADEQTHGRGTSGRLWMGLQGNFFFTVCIPMERVPVTITLLPLQIGSMVAKCVSQWVPAKTVHVKWPNDVLLEDRKVAGVLIESQLVDGTIWLLVGIGINLVRAPNVLQEGEDRGRLATSILEHLDGKLLPENAHLVMAQDLVYSLEKWLTNPTTTSKQTLDTWKAWANWKVPMNLRETGEVVMPMGIQDDGQLIVQGDGGTERNLIAEYLY